MRLERRLEQPWWLGLAIPVGSLAVAFGSMAVGLAGTGQDPGHTYRTVVDAGFTGNGALSATFLSATPILFTGLAAAAAFRMQLFNIGAEGQLYLGAVGGSWIALQLGDRGAGSTFVYVVAMCAAAAALGAPGALRPGAPRARSPGSGAPARSAISRTRSTRPDCRERRSATQGSSSRRSLATTPSRSAWSRC